MFFSFAQEIDICAGTNLFLFPAYIGGQAIGLSP